MNRNKRKFSLIGTILIMLLLMLDGKTAMNGASDGVLLCIKSVIPSLFPFITFSYILNSILSELNWKPISPLFQFCGIPEGGESLLVLGLLGGYPVGAQAVNDAYKCKRISKSDGTRLLAFCNNAGPAFIFGVSPCLFESKLVPWALWGIHISSAIIVSRLLHKESTKRIRLPAAKKVTLPVALKKSIYTVSTISGWVILFRTFEAILEKYVDNILSGLYKSIILGSTELTSGFYRLLETDTEGIRFILSSAFLGFGGICVMMQTASVTEDLGLGMYFPGKIAHSAISYFLSLCICPLLFHEMYFSLPSTILFATALIISIIILRKNSRFMAENAV
ncbi:MAG: hypothetical protein IKU07_08810 [Oscillospiraceae bacterium]|nr:hypothetical protein [Oscillospiraceae bacterium]